MTGVAKSVARLCVGQRRAQFRDVTPSSPAATASFSGLHAATSCQKGTNTNTASLPARCAGHTPNPPRQMRWRWRKLISTIPQKKLYYNTSKSYMDRRPSSSTSGTWRVRRGAAYGEWGGATSVAVRSRRWRFGALRRSRGIGCAQPLRPPRRSHGIGCAPPLRHEPPPFFFGLTPVIYIYSCLGRRP